MASGAAVGCTACWLMAGPGGHASRAAGSPVLLVNREMEWHGGAQLGCSALAELGHISTGT